MLLVVTTSNSYPVFAIGDRYDLCKCESVSVSTSKFEKMQRAQNLTAWSSGRHACACVVYPASKAQGGLGDDLAKPTNSGAIRTPSLGLCRCQAAGVRNMDKR